MDRESIPGISETNSDTIWALVEVNNSFVEFYLGNAVVLEVVNGVINDQNYPNPIDLDGLPDSGRAVRGLKNLLSFCFLRSFEIGNNGVVTVSNALPFNLSSTGFPDSERERVAGLIRTELRLFVVALRAVEPIFPLAPPPGPSLLQRLLNILDSIPDAAELSDHVLPGIPQALPTDPPPVRALMKVLPFFRSMCSGTIRWLWRPVVAILKPHRTLWNLGVLFRRLFTEPHVLIPQIWASICNYARDEPVEFWTEVALNIVFMGMPLITRGMKTLRASIKWNADSAPPLPPPKILLDGEIIPHAYALPVQNPAAGGIGLSVPIYVSPPTAVAPVVVGTAEDELVKLTKLVSLARTQLIMSASSEAQGLMIDKVLRRKLVRILMQQNSSLAL